MKLELPRTSRAHCVVGVKDLKPFHTDEFPSRPRRPTLNREALSADEYEVDSIVSHKKVKRDYFFRVKWLGFPLETDWTYEGISSFCDKRGNVITAALRDYVKQHKLDIPLDVPKVRKSARQGAQDLD